MTCDDDCRARQHEEKYEKVARLMGQRTNRIIVLHELSRTDTEVLSRLSASDGSAPTSPPSSRRSSLEKRSTLTTALAVNTASSMYSHNNTTEVPNYSENGPFQKTPNVLFKPFGLPSLMKALSIAFNVKLLQPNPFHNTQNTLSTGFSDQRTSVARSLSSLNSAKCCFSCLVEAGGKKV